MRPLSGKHTTVIFPFKSTSTSKAGRYRKASSKAKGKSQARDAMIPAVADSSSPGQDAQPPAHPAVPALFTTLPPIKDSLTTQTSSAQNQTIEDCLPHLAGSTRGKNRFDFTPSGLPRLDRDGHIDFLKDHLESARFVAYDASRPWVVYWCLTALCLLGEDITKYRQRCVYNQCYGKLRGKS